VENVRCIRATALWPLSGYGENHRPVRKRTNIKVLAAVVAATSKLRRYTTALRGIAGMFGLLYDIMRKREHNIEYTEYCCCYLQCIMCGNGLRTTYT